MINFILGLILSGFLFYTAMIYISSSLTLLALLWAVLLVLAQIFLAVTRRGLSFQMDIPITAASRERPLRIRMLIKKRGILPQQKWKLQLWMQNSFSGERSSKWLRGDALLPGKNVYEDSLSLKNCGKYELRVKRLRVYDLTGLFYRDLKAENIGWVMMLPDFESVGFRLTEQTRNFFGDAERYDEERPGPDNSETFQFREFRDGDKLQRIHWKLSVKLDDLVVREDSLPQSCPVVLFLDYVTSIKDRGSGRAEKSDMYLAIIASISFSLADAGCAHYVVWYGNSGRELVRLRVDDEESLYLFLSFFLEEHFSERMQDMEELYQEKYRGERYLHSLSLNEELELRRDGELLVRLDAKNWKEDIKSLDILL